MTEAGGSRSRTWIGCVLALVLVAGVVFVVGIGVGYFYWTSPRYSLRQIKKAVEGRDVVRFEKYVDLHAVCDSVVDRVLEEASKARDKTKGDRESFGQMLGTGLLAVMKPVIVPQVEREVKRAIEEGRVTRADGRTEVHIDDIRREGRIAHAWIRIPGQSFDPPREGDIRLNVRLDDMGTYWRATAVDALEMP